MKTNFFIQHNGSEVMTDDILKSLKKVWIDMGNKIKDIKETEIYYKIEDKTAYCIVNKSDEIHIKL